MKHVWVDDLVIQSAIREVRLQLKDEGRILVRASGTEPLIRIMIEGREYEEIHAHAKRLAALFDSRLNSKDMNINKRRLATE